MFNNQQILEHGCSELNITLTPDQVTQFITLATQLSEWNSQLNLTRIPPEQTVTHHFLDSLTVSSHLTAKAGDTVLDLGTGAGYPGLPLAIVHPEIKFVLLDSTRKKLTAVEAMAKAVGLKNVHTLHARAEDLGATHRYAAVTTRAVAAFDKLLEWQLPLVKSGGVAIMMKSIEQRDEVMKSKKFNPETMQVHEVIVPKTELRRLLVVARA